VYDGKIGTLRRMKDDAREVTVGLEVRHRAREPERRASSATSSSATSFSQNPLAVAYKRADRVKSLLQRELGTLISEELRDHASPFRR